MAEVLGSSALQRALLAQRLAPGLVVYSDWGGRYVGNAYKAMLKGAKAQPLFSWCGDCSDKAQAESCCSRLKTEVLALRERPVLADLADAQASAADYFDHYSHEWLHASIDYQTPHHTHQPLIQPNALNCPA